MISFSPPLSRAADSLFGLDLSAVSLAVTSALQARAFDSTYRTIFTARYSTNRALPGATLEAPFICRQSNQRIGTQQLLTLAACLNTTMSPPRRRSARIRGGVNGTPFKVNGLPFGVAATSNAQLLKLTELLAHQADTRRNASCR